MIDYRRRSLTAATRFIHATAANHPHNSEGLVPNRRVAAATWESGRQSVWTVVSRCPLGISDEGRLSEQHSKEDVQRVSCNAQETIDAPSEQPSRLQRIGTCTSGIRWADLEEPRRMPTTPVHCIATVSLVCINARIRQSWAWKIRAHPQNSGSRR